jgi:UDP-GlcNAc:undecaprenyl-phosphate GlcNAc-1-phosphate transferase
VINFSNQWVRFTLIPIALVVPLEPLIQAYLIGGIILFISGAWDDAKEIGHFPKFASRIIAAGVVVFYGDLWIAQAPYAGVDEVSPLFGKPFAIFAMVGMMNAINHSDGLDGLAGGESLLSLIVLAFLAFVGGDGMVAVVIACAAMGGVLGFLRFNTHPAQVFMGDTGSQFLGFTLAFLAIYLTQVCHPALSNALPLLLLGLPIVDILAVLFLRIKQKMNWFKATRNHVHHRLLDRGFNHYESVIIIYSIQAVLVISAIFMQYHGDWWVTGWYLLVCASVFIFLVVAERANWTAHRVDEESKISQLIVYLKTKGVLTVAPARLVMFMVSLFIAVTPLWITTVPRDFGMVSGVMLVVLAFEMFFGKNGDSVTARAAISVVAIFAAYLSVNYVPSIYEGFEFGRTVYFTVLAIAIATSVRFSKRISFNVTPTGYLIVFGLLTTAFFANEHFVARDTSVLLIQAVLLLYGCQLLIDQKGGRWSFLNVATLGALGVLAVRGLRL